MEQRLGFISKKYESGRTGRYTISTLRGDPGGTSYGEYQLAMNTGTLDAFLSSSGYKKEFEGLHAGSKEFNERWLELAKKDAFVEAQYEYIKKNNYQPVRDYATKLNIPEHRAIDELLFSIGVQHGRFKKILDAAKKNYKLDTPKLAVDNIMYARKQYVETLQLPQKLKWEIVIRYRNELKDLSEMLNV